MPPVKHKVIPAFTPKQLRNFWRRVAIGRRAECWPWIGCTVSRDSGYGQIKVQGKTFLSNRVAYFLTAGVDPQKLSVCHTCDNPSCCNPNHLKLGTHQDNMKQRNERSPKWADRNVRMIGAGHPRAKFTVEQVTALRAEYQQNGGNQHRLAEKFGMSHAQANKILRGVSWAS